MKYKKGKKRVFLNKHKKKRPNCRKYLKTRRKHRKQEEKETFFRKIVRAISSPGKLVHLFIATLAVVVGFIFNAFDEMPLFWLKGIFGFVLYLTLSYTIIYIEKKNGELTIELTGDPQLAKCQHTYTTKINSNYNFILCIISCIYFVTISIILDFVKTNLIGIYSLFALSCVVFLAFIVFQQYIYILFLLCYISKIKPGKFYELIPERTNWFNLLERFSNICRNLFIILGSLFIMLFMIFSPVNSIQIIFKEGISSSQFIPLTCTWIIIIVAIVFMVPFSSLVRKNLLQKIYKNLISQSIENYNRVYNSSAGENRLIYIDIIMRLNDRKYTLQNSYTWVIPLIVSITNFASVIISIIVDLKDLKLLT